MRSFTEGVFTSTDQPPLRLRVAPEFAYAGRSLFDLAGAARVERHIFVESADATVRRLVVVHFESFLPGVEDHYRYALSNTCVLGGATYGRSTGLLSVSAERSGAPTGEMARTELFLTSRGFTLPDRHAVARYARVVGDDRRRELLIFYHECEGREDGILERAERAIEHTMED